MFEYEICNVFDESIFDKQCRAIEKRIPGIIQGNKLIDVDDSIISHYQLNDKALTVISDRDFGVVIKSEFDIEPYF